MPRYAVLWVAAILWASVSVGCAEESVPDVDPGPINVSEADWPWWRGYHMDGIAPADQSPPTTWSSNEHVLWKTPIPGRGHGSPTIVGDRIFLATAETEQQIQSVICINRKTGAIDWSTPVHEGGFTTDGNKKASLASSSVACDGERVFINFLNNGAVYTTALNVQGEKLWQKKVSDYVVHQGFGSSPELYESLVIAVADNKGGGALVAFNRANGKEIWRQPRPKTANYPSPIILKADGRDQLILTGCNLVSSFDPLTGNKNWEIDGATTECVTSTVTNGKVVISSGGYPRNHVAAVRADDSGKVVWNHDTRIYVPSMFIRDGHLYAAADNGVAICWNVESGDEVWKKRLGGTFTASPVLVGDRMYAVNESGRTYVTTISPEGMEIIAKNDLGDQVYATPTIIGGRIYMRVAEEAEGRRQEFLYCLGE